jgi:hypothetical protein
MFWNGQWRIQWCPSVEDDVSCMMQGNVIEHGHDSDHHSHEVLQGVASRRMACLVGSCPVMGRLAVAGLPPQLPSAIIASRRL